MARFGPPSVFLAAWLAALLSMALVSAGSPMEIAEAFEAWRLMDVVAAILASWAAAVLSVAGHSLALDHVRNLRRPRVPATARAQREPGRVGDSSYPPVAAAPQGCKSPAVEVCHAVKMPDQHPRSHAAADKYFAFQISVGDHADDVAHVPLRAARLPDLAHVNVEPPASTHSDDPTETATGMPTPITAQPAETLGTHDHWRMPPATGPPPPSPTVIDTFGPVIPVTCAELDVLDTFLDAELSQLLAEHQKAGET